MLSLRAFEERITGECLPNLTTRPCCSSCELTAASRPRTPESAVATGSSAPRSCCAIIGAGAWWVLAGPRGVPVHTALARAVPGGGTGGSVLDATGYVTARREATVSAQITGTLTQVLIEEGDHVEEGQVLATLEDTAQRAALAQAQAQLHTAQALLAQYQAQLAQSERDAKRAEDLVERKLVSQQAVEQARTQVETQSAQVETQRKQVELATASVQRRAGAARLLHRARAVRRRRHRQGRAGRRDRLAALGRRRLHAHRHRHDRRHGFARDRGRRQRGLHRPRAARAAGRGRAQRLSGLEDPRARHRHHPDRRSQQGDREGARRRSIRRIRASCRTWACACPSWRKERPKRQLLCRRRVGHSCPRAPSARKDGHDVVYLLHEKRAEQRTVALGGNPRRLAPGAQPASASRRRGDRRSRPAGS